MDTITYFNLIFRLVIWFLLTSDFSLPNIIIGLAIAILLPRANCSFGLIKDWLKMSLEIIKAIPKAYLEAIEIIIRPHAYEDIIREKVKPRRTPGLIFLDIFLITFTPKTIVTKYDEQGWYEIHRIRRKKAPKSNYLPEIDP